MKTLSASAIFALAIWPRTLLAQPAPTPAPTPIYVTARLAPECRGAADFAQRLLARTHRLRWATPGEPGIVFDIAAQTFQGGFIGQLQIQEIDGRFTQRSVEGTTCDGVINALAFVAAVLVDPEAAQRIETQAPGPPPLPLPPAPEFSVPKIFDWGIGVTLGATSATSNSLLQPNVGARVTLAWNGPGFSPWITVGYDQRFNSKVSLVLDSTQNQTANTTFGGWAANVAFSPVRWPDAGHYFLRPAALLEIGQLTASASVTGQNVTGQPPQSRLWLAPGLGASAEARISRPVAAVADLGLVFPANKHWDYVYATPGGEKRAFLVPDAGLSARLGFIVKFE